MMNYENPNSKHHITLIIYFLLILISIVIYLCINTPTDSTTKTTLINNDVNTSLLTSDIEKRVADSLPTYRQSNKNGTTMANSLNCIKDIMFELNYSTDRERMQEMIDTIENLDLSKEYDTVKENVIKKIQCMMKYQSTGEDKYLDEYNNIDYLQYLEAAFDIAQIEYEKSENGIIYWYYPD